MNTYSLDFLHDDWDGAGYDFELAVVFDQRRINEKSVKEFIENVAASSEISIKYISQENTTKWQYVLKDGIKMFLGNRFQWKATQLLVVEITTTHGFSGYVELNQPDQLVVGGPSVSYYKGNSHSDLTVARDIVDIITLGVKSFGNGYGYFGAGSNAVEEAISLRTLGKYPNLTTSASAGSFVEEIVEKCTELRLL